MPEMPPVMRAAPVEPFDKDAYNRFQLPEKVGAVITSWDDPEMVPVSEASHMRPDDYVVGLVFRGRPRAYPLWVVDHYHVLNDRVDGERFVLVSCDRCQSGAAFLSEIPGRADREPLFRAVGFMNATLLMKDHRTASHWIHYRGYGLDRKASGVSLPWLPTFHMEWADWVALHPDTVVMTPPDDPRHPDARHGHGREEYFARPGMDLWFITTIAGPYDDTYPENEMVLALEGDGEWIAYPLREVQRESGVVRDHIGGRPIAVLAGPRADGFTMAAFLSRARDTDLTLDREDGSFRDRETGSDWTIEGVAVRGPMAGERLEPVSWSYLRWHAWVYWHRATRLFRSTRTVSSWPEETADFTDSGISSLLSAWSEARHDVRVEGQLVSQRRPRRSLASIVASVDGHRVVVHHFESESAARDFDAVAGTWSTWPIKARSHEGRTRRISRLVVESDPHHRFVDPAQVVPTPATVVEWAPIVGGVDPEETVLGDAGGGGGATVVAPGFLDLIRGLSLAGVEVMEYGMLPPGQLRVGCEDGMAMTIDGDRFLVYLFGSPGQAAAYAAAEPHALAAGSFVLRSAPDDMYVHHGYEILYVGDDRVRWSSRLRDPGFRALVERVAGERRSQ
jgi:hypothetical protein